VNTEHSLLEALHRDPADHAARLVLADWLEEQGRAEQAEVARLHARQLTGAGTRKELARLCELLEGGVRPVVPEVVNSIGMRLAHIPPGAYIMGSPPQEAGREENEGPRHEVRIKRPFYLGVFPVTQGEYKEVTGKGPSHFSASGDGKDKVKGLDTSRFPVEWVTHTEAVRFCARLSARAKEKRAGRVYRLPTEAEWEYACRGGAAVVQPFHFGDSLSPRHANFNGERPYKAKKGPHLDRPSPVGSYPPNAFGLYDMHGNVWEWCADWFRQDYYARCPMVDPTGPQRGTERVMRGGSFHYGADCCRSAYRGSNAPSYRDIIIGFRVAMTLTVPTTAPRPRRREAAP
jgi:uncharacterized protein (TIGR02996 family)